MLEDVLMNLTSMIPTGSGDASVGADALPLSYICSGAGAFILAKFTGSLGGLTLPVNYSALLIGALLANWLFTGVSLPIEHNLHQPLLVSLTGMVLGAFAIMWWYRGENATA